MDVIAFSARLLAVFFRLTNRGLSVEVLAPAHKEAATQLLSEEFCRREPLCRVLGIRKQDIEEVFRQQVDYAVAQGLSVVVVDASGRVQGVVTVEDHRAPFVPDRACANSSLDIINELLDTLTLPAALQPAGVGEVYYCGLAAVAHGQRKATVLMTMIVAIFRHLRAKGYRRGYAKITNARIGRKFQRLEQIFRRPIFTPSAEVYPAAFPYHDDYPLRAFRGSICLFTWPMSFEPRAGDPLQSRSGRAGHSHGRAGSPIDRFSSWP